MSMMRVLRREIEIDAPRSPEVGGQYAARALATYPVRITLVNRENYHLFQPLLYQVATAGLSPADLAVPIRFILCRHANVLMRCAWTTALCTAKAESDSA